MHIKIILILKLTIAFVEKRVVTDTETVKQNSESFKKR